MSESVISPRVLTVHESGYDLCYHSDGLDIIVCERYFVRTGKTERHIVSSSIKGITEFELPVFKFQKRIEKKWKIFKKTLWRHRKVGTERGCIITFLDGHRMFVSETLTELKIMIEGGKKPKKP